MKSRTPKPFSVYRASAGSGKTTALVRMYLMLALQSDSPDYYRHILAITFTNKAADEMKSRVLEALSTFAHGDAGSGSIAVIGKQLQKDLSISAEELTARAQGTLSHLLHHYADFSISTIDSFTHRIIRTFAHDLQLPVSFEIELDVDRIIALAVDSTIAQAGNESVLSDTLLQFAGRNVEENERWRLDQALFDFSKKMFKEEQAHHLESFSSVNPTAFLEYAKQLQQRIGELKTSVTNAVNTAKEGLVESGINVENLAEGKKGIPKLFEAVDAGHFDKELKSAMKLIQKEEWAKKSLKVGERRAIEEMVSPLKPIIINALETYNEASEVIRKCYFLYKRVYPFAASIAVRQELLKYQEEHSVVPISEFNRKIAEIVTQEPAPFIYERLGERYHHYLIDEFQDTSEMQWQNLVPLVDNALASEYLNLLVGDAKQAIYRWRGGNSQQFTQLPELAGTDNPIIAEREASLKRHYQETRLAVNYRSSPEVIQFNNWLYNSLSEAYPDALGATYKNQEQEIHQKKESGLVMAIHKTWPEKDSDLEVEWVLNQVWEAVSAALDDGYSKSEICLITRKRSQSVQLADLLLAKHIPVLSSESLLLSKYPPVQLLVACIGYLSQPFDQLTRARLAFCLNMNSVGNFVLHEVLFKLNKDRSHFDDFLSQQGIMEELERIKFSPLSEVTDHLIRYFFPTLGNDAYLESFRELVFDFSDRHGNLPQQFLSYWERKKSDLSVDVPKDADAIQIMTIHKSKGLEFPVVIFPWVNKSARQDSEIAWVNTGTEYAITKSPVGLNEQSAKSFQLEKTHSANKQKTLEEFINLLYVGTTRAESRLIIISSDYEQSRRPKHYTNLILNHPSFDAEKGCLQFGERLKRDKPEKTTIDPETWNYPIQKPWEEKIRFALTAHRFREEGDSRREAKMYGNLIHAAIEKYIQGSSLNEIVDLALAEGWLSDQDKSAFYNHLNAVVSHPEIEPFLNAETVLSERELVDASGNLLRPDLVAISGEKHVVVDFKTGTPHPKHEEQVNQYRSALGSLTNQSVEGYIVYTSPLRLIQISSDGGEQMSLFS